MYRSASDALKNFAMEQESIKYRLALENTIVLLNDIQRNVLIYAFNLARLKELNCLFSFYNEEDEFKLPHELLWKLDDKGIKTLIGFFEDLNDVFDGLFNTNSLDLPTLELAVEKRQGLEDRDGFKSPLEDSYNAWVQEVRDYLQSATDAVFFRLSDLHHISDSPRVKAIFKNNADIEHCEEAYSKDRNVILLYNLVQKMQLITLHDEPKEPVTEESAKYAEAEIA